MNTPQKLVNNRSRRLSHVFTKLYPFLLSLYPVLNMLASNFQEIDVRDSLRALLTVPVATGVLYYLLAKITRDSDKGGLLTSLFLVFFFSYGHLYSSMKDVTIGALLVGRHRYLFPILTIIFLLFARYILKRSRIGYSSIKTITMISTLLIMIPIGSIIYQSVSAQTSWKSELETYQLEAQRNALNKDLELPDIYYIILDGYARSDYLHSILGFDNTDFLYRLRAMGFYIAEDSNTNFNWTALSLSSSLNIDFVQSLGLDLVYGNYPAVFIEPIRHSRVRTFLEDLGYSTVAFRTNYLPTEIIDADYYLTVEPEEYEELSAHFSFNSLKRRIGSVGSRRPGNKKLGWL
jgi:hypothetical protein